MAEYRHNGQAVFDLKYRLIWTSKLAQYIGPILGVTCRLIS